MSNVGPARWIKGMASMQITSRLGGLTCLLISLCLNPPSLAQEFANLSPESDGCRTTFNGLTSPTSAFNQYLDSELNSHITGFRFVQGRQIVIIRDKNLWEQLFDTTDSGGVELKRVNLTPASAINFRGLLASQYSQLEASKRAIYGVTTLSVDFATGFTAKFFNLIKKLSGVIGIASLFEDIQLARAPFKEFLAPVDLKQLSIVLDSSSSLEHRAAIFQDSNENFRLASLFFLDVIISDTTRQMVLLRHCFYQVQKGFQE